MDDKRAFVLLPTNTETIISSLDYSYPTFLAVCGDVCPFVQTLLGLSTQSMLPASWNETLDADVSNTYTVVGDVIAHDNIYYYWSLKLVFHSMHCT